MPTTDNSSLPPYNDLMFMKEFYSVALAWLTEMSIEGSNSSMENPEIAAARANQTNSSAL